MCAMTRLVFVFLAMTLLAGLPGLLKQPVCGPPVSFALSAAAKATPCSEDTAVSPTTIAKTHSCECSLIYLPPNTFLTAVTLLTFLSVGLILRRETAVTSPPTPPPRLL